jgi:5-methyltetrahydrofolate--homocysteine methyltransferase
VQTDRIRQAILRASAEARSFVHTLIQQLLSRGPILTDGAWGTELQMRGLGLGEFPDSWNLSHPDRVLEVAKAYVEAGSEIILTNTFGSNRIRLATDGLANQVIEINRAGTTISRAAASGRALVFASIGPTGALLLDETVSPAQIHDAFAEQATALAEAGADGLVIETMSDVAEAKLALEAVRPTGLPVVVSMVFDSGPKKDYTMMGQNPEQIATILTAAGADVIGANCGSGINGFAAICRRMRAASSAPIWIKPNAGLPEIVNGSAQYRVTAQEFVRHVPEVIASGADFIGGCCGTNPNFIRALRDMPLAVQPGAGPAVASKARAHQH